MKEKPTPMPPLRQAFLEWYHVTKLGQTLRAIEGSYLRSAIKFNYNETILQLGYLGSETLYIEQHCLSRFLMINPSDNIISNTVPLVRAKIEKLPLPSESIETVILPHVLDFENESRQEILIEIERILKPEGRLFVLGLNPWTPSGILHFLRGSPSPFRSGFVSSHWIVECLESMKFDSSFDAAFFVSSSPVLNRPSTLWTKARAALAFAYAVKAIKRRYSLIPTEPCWMNAPSLATGQLLERLS